ncbi:MAG: Flavohemoprotein [Anaerolineales bacterium]|nr:Flavohemoprotein [Anaerolineales bacterium]WKZ46604.1 MAG: ferric reductase-like transmembrane domain-containing protein [Anaerolineales bacterium]
MKRSNLGNLFIIFLVCLTIVVWLVFPPVNDGREKFIRQYAGEIIGSINIVLMACSLTLAARPKWAEPYFGGLDKMYMTHRHTSTAALLLIFVHVLTVPISLSGWALGNYLAVIAFTGIVSIALVSLSPRIPFLNRITGGTYEGWKNLKKYVGIFFILAFIHSLTIRDPLNAFIAINYVQVFFIIGTVAYLQTQFFGRFFKKHIPYTVEQVNHPTNFTTEVTLRAKGAPIAKQRAGQFLFVRFPSEKNLNESHPFTISSAPHEDVLRLTIKASGDFTRALFNELKPEADAIVEGAHGMFDYKTGGQKQIWIAGGIGVTPFLSFIRDLRGTLDHDVDFYYTMRHRDEVLFYDEIETAGIRNPRLKVNIRYSAIGGSLTVEEIAKNAGGDVRRHHIYMCGPLPMVQAFEKKFLALGVPGENIHFEEFNFR